MHKHAEHVARTHQPPIEKRQAWQGHEQNQRCGDYDPRCIGSIHCIVPSFVICPPQSGIHLTKKEASCEMGDEILVNLQIGAKLMRKLHAMLKF
jgi:hypothetical protein